MLPTLKAGSAEMTGEPPNPVDAHIGRRVRMRRIEINMSQEFLGEQIGVTFQQIQKYEKGANRVVASRLQEIGKVLEVPASFFFDGAPGGCQGESGSQTSAALLELLGTREGQILINSFVRITDAEIRRSFVCLIEKAATLIDSKPPKPKRSSPRPKPKPKK
jgi:transcriptional regulator with XRE-family HTH domain